MRLCQSDCAGWYAYVHGNSSHQSRYRADPDIAGIGIICAFVATSFITLCLGLANLVLTASSTTDRNRIDISIFELLRHAALIYVTEECRTFWIPIIEKTTLALSDQQILTGLSVLVTGFVTQCSISAYHFAVVDDLAWFSANVHLTGLGILRGYLCRSPVSRAWRVCMMLVVAGFITASTVMQGHWAYYISWSFDAHCLFDDLVGNTSGQPGIWMWVDLVAIAIIYPMSMLPLYQTSLSVVREIIYDGPMKFLDTKIESLRDEELRGLGQPLAGVTAARIVFSTIRTLYFWWAEILTSRCIVYVFDLAWFGYGVANIIANRQIPASQTDGNESALTLSQVFPMLLLCSTTFVFWEACEEQKRRNKALSQRLISQAQCPQNQDNSAVTTPSIQTLEMRAIEDAGESTTATVSLPYRVNIGTGDGPQPFELGGRLQG